MILPINRFSVNPQALADPTHRTASATDGKSKQVTYDMDQRMAHARISVHSFHEQATPRPTVCRSSIPVPVLLLPYCKNTF